MKKILNIVLILIVLSSCTKAPWESYSPPAELPHEEEPVDSVEIQGDTTILRVMSIGTAHSSAAMARFAELADSLDVELLVAREIDMDNTRSGKGVLQAKDLADLAGMNYFFAKAQDYAGGEYGLAVLSKFPIEDSYTEVFPGSRPLGMITITKDDKKIVFAGMQMDDRANRGADRATQANLLLNVTAGVKDPLILGGCFFIMSKKPELDPTMQILSQQFTPGCTDCEFTFPKGDPLTAMADHIMYKVKPGIKVNVLRYEVIKNVPVNRMPVFAEIEIIQ